MKAPPLLALALTLLVVPLHAQDPAFEVWSARLAEDYLRVRPQVATAQQYFSGAEQDALDRQLDAVGREAQLARAAEAQKALGELGRFDRTKFSAEQKVSARFAQLDLTLQPPAGADPRPMLLSRYTEILRDAERRAALLFDETPKAPIEVRREPRWSAMS